MPIFTIVSNTVAQGSETAEIDNSQGDFRSADEAIGYGRRLAEELFELADQLVLDFEYTHVALYEGDADPQELDVQDETLLGLWMFVEDGIAWTSAQALRDEQESEPADG